MQRERTYLGLPSAVAASQRASHKKYREDEDFLRKGAKAQSAAAFPGFLCAFAALREK